MIEMIKEYPLLLAALIGLAIGAPMAWKRRSQIGIKNVWQFMLLCVLSWTTGYAGMKAIAWLEELLFQVTIGRRNYGFFLLEPFVLLLLSKFLALNKKALFDALTLYSIPTLFLGRVVCIIEECCYGKMIPGTAFRWPTREAELIFFIILFVILLKNEQKEAFQGQLYPILMIAYGGFRFIIEWFRIGDTAMLGMRMPHFWSIALIVVGISIFIEQREQTERRAHRKYRR